MIKKSENPLLSSIQDFIFEKFDLESWASDERWAEGGVVKWGPQGIISDWIDICIFGEESHIFTVGIVNDKIIIYRPDIDNFDYGNEISLYDHDFLEKLCNLLIAFKYI